MKIKGNPIAVASGVVIHGQKQARKFGTPTANLACNLSIPEGVYEARTDVSTLHLFQVPSLVYVTKGILESHLIGYFLDLYDLHIDVYLTQFIRAPEPFISMDQMRNLIQRDLESIFTNLSTLEKRWINKNLISIDINSSKIYT